MSGMFSVLKVEIDGHFHGGEPIKPWVAEIKGTDPKWGLARRFLDPKNDWSSASVSWSGNIYGRVAHFFLRDGGLYEVQRCTGKPSKRRVVREFIAVRAGKRVRIEPEEALAIADGGGEAITWRIPEDREGTSWISRVRGLGTPERLGFAVVGTERLYRLKEGGVYELVELGKRPTFVGVRDADSHHLTEAEAWSWLMQASTRSA